ncbi:MAG: PQQ-binding-like beta-propeller repeat protein, partial [Pirellulaceae bacterium]|nr:PQQ-binding-like beta-propeller repeat protein [Pirellulaceae bacterium]
RADSADGVPNSRSGRFSFPTRGATNITNPLVPSNNRNNLVFDKAQGTIGAVNGLEVTYLRGRQLVCVEALTGKVLWERTGIEPGSDVFGDEQRIVVIAPEERSHQALVYSAIDGTLLDRRMVDPQDRRWATCGRNVLAWETGDGKAVHLRLYDASNQGTGLWSKNLDRLAKGFIIDGEELALMEPSGRFTVVSLRSGKELMVAQVEPEPALQSIAVVASRGQYLLTTSQPPSGETNGVTASPLQNGWPAGFSVHGNVYAFDRASGATQWQSPAFVSQHALPPDQPTESPVLVFARLKRVFRSGSATSNIGSVLCLDRRDGSIVFEEDGFSGQATLCDTVVDREARSVVIQVSGSDGSRALSLKFTDNPAPPRPPAQTGMMSSRTLGEQRGTVVDVAADVFRALNQMPPGNRNGVPPGIPIPLRGLRLPGGLPPVQPR